MSILLDGNYFARKYFHGSQDKTFTQQENLDNFRHLFLYNIINVKRIFSKEYGELIIAKDFGTWRKDILKSYKAKRDEKNKDDSILEFFQVYEEMINLIKDNTNIKVISKEKTEADDIIYILSKLPGKHMVYSSDKDLVQCKNDNVAVFDFNNKRFIEKSNESISNFKLEHIIQGDTSDNISNIAWNADYQPKFAKWMLDNNNIEMSQAVLLKMIKEDSEFFNDYLVETKSKPFKSIRMGEKTAIKIVAEGNLDALLESNPIIKRNFKINQFLIDMDFIPKSIVDSILKINKDYKYKIENINELHKYCDLYNLNLVRERLSWISH